MPIFIVGYMHSGTTLLRNIAARAEGVYTIAHETKFFERIALFKKQYPDLHDAATLQAYVQALLAQGTDETIDANRIIEALPEDQGRTHDAVFGGVFDVLAQQAGKAVWLEKTPGHIFRIKDILAAFPEARIIEIVRDPRDVLASKKTRRATVWTTQRYDATQRADKHLEKAYDPLWDTLSWKAALQAGQQAQTLYPDHLHTVRYEDLIQQPEATVQTVCDFLGLSFVPAMMEVPAGIAADWKGEPAEGGVRKDSLARWKAVLNESEVALCQRLVGDEMQQMHYALMPIALAQYAGVLPLLLRSMLDLLRRIYHRGRQHGMAYMFNVVRGYLHRLKRLAT